MNNPYLGPAFSNEEIKSCIDEFRSQLENQNCKVEVVTDDHLLCKKAAEYIASGKILGWFQGRTEYGPRALGNRSILVDPRKKEMKEILNLRVKKREWYRPFAPSIIEEKTTEWFESDYPVPFMEKVYKIKKEKRSLVPAVCHVDGTGRLQTVSEKLNQKYYTLIKAFENLSGVPMVLNTSFNDNEPIVNSPKDALQCFLSTNMDVLILESYIITKNEK